MEKYFITHQHKPGECSRIKELFMNHNDNPLRGKTNVICTCPSEVHEFYVRVDAKSLDEAKQSVPEELRNQITVMRAEGFTM